MFQQLPILALIERKIQSASFSSTYLLATIEVSVCLSLVCMHSEWMNMTCSSVEGSINSRRNRSLDWLCWAAFINLCLCCGLQEVLWCMASVIILRQTPRSYPHPTRICREMQGTMSAWYHCCANAVPVHAYTSWGLNNSFFSTARWHCVLRKEMLYDWFCWVLAVVFVWVEHLLLVFRQKIPVQLKEVCFHYNSNWGGVSQMLYL